MLRALPTMADRSGRSCVKPWRPLRYASPAAAAGSAYGRTAVVKPVSRDVAYGIRRGYLT